MPYSLRGAAIGTVADNNLHHLLRLHPVVRRLGLRPTARLRK